MQKVSENSVVRVYERLCRPYGIAIADKNTLIVAQNGDHCVSFIDKKGDYMSRTLGRRPRDANELSGSTGSLSSLATAPQPLFHFPRGVAVSKDRRTLVTDSHQLKKINDAGKIVKCIGERTPGEGGYSFDCPAGVAVDRVSGTIFVADCENHRVQSYSNNLDFLHTIAAGGGLKKSGSVNNPIGLAVDENQKCIYVVEWFSQVKKISLDGGCVLTTIGSPVLSADEGSLSHPTSIAIDHQYNLLYVTERGNNRVSVFDANGTFVRCFGEKGKYVGQFDGPYGAAIDDVNYIYISDYYNNRIVMYDCRKIEEQQ